MTARKANRPPNQKGREDKTTPEDLYKFLTGEDELLEIKGVIRRIVDDDPIDLAALEAKLREGLSAIRKLRSSSMTTKKLHWALASYERHYTSLLELIVGKHH
jgi:hypothetical protein